MMKTMFSKLSKTMSSNNHKLMTTATKAFSVVGANGRRLPLPDDKPLQEFDPEMAQLILKE